MTPRQIALIKESWKRVKPNAAAVAELFYGRLFELDPTVRALFKRDMPAQGRMLTNMIDVAVSQLDAPEKLLPVIRELGARHATYGVQDRHYVTVGAALLDTLATGLGTAFTHELRDAWADVYTVIASTMKAGAAQSSAAAT